MTDFSCVQTASAPAGTLHHCIFHRRPSRGTRHASCRLSAVALLLALCVVWLSAAPAPAQIREVDPGEIPRLAADEGLLMVSVDSDVELGSVRIQRERGILGDTRNLRGVGEGRNFRLYAVDAGRYRWANLDRKRRTVRLSLDKAHFGFEVRPGAINYPGDLIFRGKQSFFGRVHVANRSLAVLDWLQGSHPALLRDFGFAYSGHYPDPFPAKYREVLAAAGKAGAAPPQDTHLPAPAPGELPIPIAELWKPGQLSLVEMSPDGRLVGEVVTFKKGADWRWGVNLIDIRAATSVRLFEAPKPIWRLDWVTARDLVMSVGASHEPDALLVAKIIDGPGGRTYGKVVVPRLGVIVAVLADEPGHLLFSSRNPRGQLQIHKLDVRSQEGLKKFRFAERDKLNEGVEEARLWLADARGRLRVAIVTDKDGDRIMKYGIGEEFRDVLNLDAEDTDFAPVALSADGSLIYGTAEEERDQRELVEFDPAQGKVTRTLFSLPGVDVENALIDPKGRLIGATYYRDGLLYSHYFDEDNARLAERLRRAFPGKTAVIVQRNPEGNHFLVSVGGSDAPTAIYHFEPAASRATLISETRPWLDKYSFVPAQTLRAKSKDGLDIEAYLTLPKRSDGSRPPLVVFPHGGPLGIRDTRDFDPEVQFLASLGYAVLQVNFRGSEGFGTAFRKAGQRKYGSAIEDDIDAALAAALGAHPLDASRMCMLGSSYGGYSSLVSAIRWPGRFRCAVSIAGISDRALFFTASDGGRTEEGRKALEEAIGNPNTDMDEMKRYSPLYRYEELQVPVMLIHGSEDLRVDYEHSRRLVRMLNLAGRPPVLVELKGEGHQIANQESIPIIWGAVAGFLRQHLEGKIAPPPPSAADKVSKQPAPAAASP